MNDEKGQIVAAELGDLGDFLHVDVSCEADIAAAVSRAGSRWGRLDVMFNNAGFGGARGPVESITEDDFDITVDVLLKGVFFGMKHAAPVMKAQGSGSVISTASVAGLQAGEVTASLHRHQSGSHSPHKIGRTRTRATGDKSECNMPWGSRNATSAWPVGRGSASKIP